MKCNNCGNEFEGNFCPKCGNTVAPASNSYVPNMGAMQHVKKTSGLGIAAFVLSIIPCTFFIGLIMGIIDLCINSKKKKTGLSIAAIIISCVWLIIAIASGAFNSNAGKKTSGSKDNATATSGSTEQSSSETESEEIDNKSLYSGDSYEYSGLKVTVNSVNNNFTDYDNDWESPNEGYKYVQVNMTYENTDDSGTKYVSIYDYDCYADNTLCEQAYSLDDSNFMNANISAGRNVTFSVYFQVPENSQSIELEYTSNSLWANLDDIKIVIQ